MPTPNCPPGCIDTAEMSRVLAAAADLALVVDPEGTIADITTGDHLEDAQAWKALAGRRWSDTIAPDSRKKVEALLSEARDRGVTRSREVNQRAEGAGEAPFRFAAVRLSGDDRVLALGHDMRAVSRMQQEMLSAQQALDREYVRLRQAETRYRVLFQVSGEGVVIADAANLRVQEVNPAAAALLDETPLNLQRRTLAEVFDPATFSAVQAQIAAVEAGGRPADIRAALAGREREVLVSVSLFRQAGTKLLLVRLQGVAPDAAAGARTSRMLAAVEAMPEGFAVTDPELRLVGANTAFCELVQQASENQVLGQPLDRWVGRPGVDLNIMLASLREHGSVRNFATIVRGDYGAEQEAVVSAVSALDGKVPCFGFSVRSVSARLTPVPTPNLPMARSVDQLRELVGRVPLREIVRESADLIERLCIEAALDVSSDNRALAAQLLGLSRQGLYSKMRRYGLGDLEAR